MSLAASRRALCPVPAWHGRGPSLPPWGWTATAVTLCAAAAVAAPLPAGAAGEPAARPEARVTRSAEHIRADGVLDEPAWRDAVPIAGFRLAFVREGEAPCESTTVRVVLDDDAIAFGIEVTNASPGAVRASLAPRDQITDGDHLSVHLDPWLDRRRAYVFGVNPYGVQLDGLLAGDEPDLTWDAVWDSGARRGPGGWTAEMRVPLRVLHFPAAGGGRWGLWMRQEIRKRDEICTWPVYRLAVTGDIMRQAGDLTGLEGLRDAGAFEIEPYAASTFDRVRAQGPAGLEPWARDERHDVGVDVRAGITSTLAFNATLNPDFSQIEADALQLDVNRRFPLRYDEKRPFFLEGKDVFEFPLDLVYTRRFADPTWGAKFTGRAGAVRLGALLVHDDGGGTLEGVGGHAVDAPTLAGTGAVARASLDLGEQAGVGFLVAGREARDERRDVAWAAGDPPPGSDARIDRDANGLAALDGRMALTSRLRASALVAASTTTLDSVHTGYAAAAGSRRFGGWAGHARIEWNDGVRLASLTSRHLGSDFRDELGFLDRVGVTSNTLFTQWRFERPARWMRVWTPNLEVELEHDPTGVPQEAEVLLGADWDLEGQLFLWTGYERGRERWLARDYDRDRAHLYLHHTRWRLVEVEIDASAGDGILYAPTDAESDKGWSEEQEIAVTVRPSPALTAALTATRQRFARSFDGPTRFDVWALGAKTTWQFTRRLYARVYPQYDTGSRHLDVDGLLGYVVHPGTVAYLGLSGDGDRVAGRTRDTRRVVFVKLSYRFGV